MPTGGGASVSALNVPAPVETKYCKGCEQHLPRDAFSLKNKATGHLHARCKECQRGYTRAHYANNRELYIERAATRNKTLRRSHQDTVEAYLADKACCGCGKTELLTLFRKAGYEGKAVHEIISAKMSFAALQQALDNSDVLCRSCYGVRMTANLPNHPAG
jgi:hypothetical protein